MSSMQPHDESGSVPPFHPSADGETTLIPVPGGRVRAMQWEGLADLADEFGDGQLQLTSRADLQISGVRDSGALIMQLGALGLGVAPLIMSSPLSPGLMMLVDALVPVLPATGPVVGIDAGDGAIIAAGPDIGLIAAGADDQFQLVVGGDLTGLVVAGDSAVEALLVMVAHRGDDPALFSRLEGFISGRCETVLPVAAPRPAPIGWMQDGDRVILGAGLREGRLEAQLARFLAAIETDIWITPWNSLVIHGLSDAVADQVVKVLAPMGLIFDADSPAIS